MELQSNAALISSTSRKAFCIRGWDGGIILRPKSECLSYWRCGACAGAR